VSRYISFGRTSSKQHKLIVRLAHQSETSPAAKESHRACSTGSIAVLTESCAYTWGRGIGRTRPGAGTIAAGGRGNTGKKKQLRDGNVQGNKGHTAASFSFFTHAATRWNDMALIRKRD
jgi:hypothetical protein